MQLFFCFALFYSLKREIYATNKKQQTTRHLKTKTKINKKNYTTRIKLYTKKKKYLQIQKL